MSRRPVVPMTPRLQAMLAAQEDFSRDAKRRIAEAVDGLRAEENRLRAGLDLPPAPSKEEEQAESEFQADVIAYLRSAKGVQQIDVDHTRKGLPAGIPDLRFAYRGRPVFFELKRAHGRTTEAQDRDHERRMMDGWIGGVFRTLPDIKAFLDSVDILEAQGENR